MIYEFEGDELSVGIRKSDESPWVKVSMGEYQKEVAGELMKVSGPVRLKVTIELLERG